MTDGQLLAEFARTRSETAFAEVVRRHGRMVYNVCLRIARRPELAEEAAQAAFLTLARKAGAVSGAPDAGGWLHQVAGFTARRALQAEARRLAHEKEAAAMRQAGSTDSGWEALAPELDRALAELPEAQRQVVVGLYLEGQTQRELSQALDVPEGTVASRSERALSRLREHLERRGVTLGAAPLAALLGANASAAGVPACFASLPGMAASFAAKSAVGGPAASLAEGVIRTMFWKSVTKWMLGAAAAACLLLVVGVAVMAGTPAGDPPGPPPVKPKEGTVTAAPVVQAKGNLSARSEALREQFARHYQPVKLDLKAPKAPQYGLPLDTAKVENWAKVAGLYLRDKDAEALLRKNGFAAVGFAEGPGDDVVEFYNQLKIQGVPIFVTSDSLLHLYHIQFDETLKDIEEREFFKDALALSLVCYQASVKQQAEFTDARLKEAARRNAAHFAVALECLATDCTRGEVQKARDEVARWKGDGWQNLHEFPTQFPVAYAAALVQAKGQGWELLRDKASLLGYLDKAMAAAPAGKKEVEYTLGADIKDDVAKELALIEKHEGFAPSPIFKYKEDYSQYVPRGHYTRSEQLKRYFKALMWYGRLTFVIKGKSDPGGALENVTDEDARIQTTGGLLAADLLRTLKLADGRDASAVWDRLYAVTAYYVGLADDLTPYEYTDSAAKALGGRYKAADLASDKDFKAYKLELAKLRGPEIYSGTGGYVAPPSASEADLMKALEKTKGFRLMGQRYIPDSYMMGRLVFPTVAPWGGGKYAFTTVDTLGGPVRGFPRGLDVMAVLGSERARQIVKELRDDNYPRKEDAKSYDEVLAELQSQFGAVSEKDWNRNLYWAWLYSLKALLVKNSGSDAEGLPTFMKTVAWQDKQLNAALASWSQLRHDTILYAKQSYGAELGGMPPEPKMVEGYVEPVPEFYARLLSLTRMTIGGLGEMKVLTKESEARMRIVEKVLARLVDISTRELQNEKLGAEDYAFIREFAEQIKGAVAGVADNGMQTTIIADVHTDQNTRQCLEEGTGLLRNLLVVYPMPDGGFVVGVGPGLSYYEFKHPMGDRLTDEKWKSMLRGAEKPALPEWVGTFSAGK